MFSRRNVLIGTWIGCFGLYAVLVRVGRNLSALGSSAALGVGVLLGIALAVGAARLMGRDRLLARIVGFAIPFVFLSAAVVQAIDESAVGEPCDTECKIEQVFVDQYDGMFRIHVLCTLPEGPVMGRTSFFDARSEPGGPSGVIHAKVRRGLFGSWFLDLTSLPK